MANRQDKLKREVIMENTKLSESPESLLHWYANWYKDMDMDDQIWATQFVINHIKQMVM